MKDEYVSFETARLLKEKGFNEPCPKYYTGTGSGILTEDFGMWRSNDDKWLDDGFSAPSHQVAMRWLREEKGIVVGIRASLVYVPLTYVADIVDASQRKMIDCDIWGKTYEETVEKALQYCLKELRI